MVTSASSDTSVGTVVRAHDPFAVESGEERT